MLNFFISKPFFLASALQSKGDEPLWREILEHIREHWFAVELSAYEYIRITPHTEGNLRMLIISAMLGVILACAITLYNKKSVGGFVKKLIRAEALSPKQAVTLYETGYFRHGWIRNELRRGRALRRYVRCVEEEAYAAAGGNPAADGSEDARESTPADTVEKGTEFKMDFSSMHFYIPEEEKYAAEVRYEQKGSGALAFLLITVGTIIVGVLLSVFLPDLLYLADRLIAMTAPA